MGVCAGVPSHSSLPYKAGPLDTRSLLFIGLLRGPSSNVCLRGTKLSILKGWHFQVTGSDLRIPLSTGHGGSEDVGLLPGV